MTLSKVEYKGGIAILCDASSLAVKYVRRYLCHSRRASHACSLRKIVSVSNAD